MLFVVYINAFKFIDVYILQKQVGFISRYML